MPRYVKRTELPVAPADAFAYHAMPGALRRLLPPWLDAKIIRSDESIRDGSRVELKQRIGPIWKRWIAEHFGYLENQRFQDRQLVGPFRSWTHTHAFVQSVPAASSALCEMIDTIDYEMPGGAIGRLLGGGHVAREIERMFRFRATRTFNDLRRHAEHVGRPRLHVAVSGASGSVAANLMPFLTTGGHCVSRLARESSADDDAIAWNAATGEVDETKLSACDAVVHLAGKNIATRWTRREKQAIWDSRVPATRRLAERLASMKQKPRVMVCASAVGYYGDRGDERLTESSPPGDGFAAELCTAWEDAARPAIDAGIRVVHLRIGVVLSANSGALPKLLTPAKLGLAGPIAGGQMFMPWIAMDDLVGMIHAALMQDDWQGPVHAVTDSLRQCEFIRTLGDVLRRPTIAPMPGAIVKVLFGEMGKELLLASANAQPPGVTRFEPLFGTLESALRFELGRQNV